MGVTRRIIFPSVRIVLWAVIAVALVKIAFAGAVVAPTTNPLRPTAQIVEAHVVASARTITNTVTVRASVVSDAATAVRATLAGTVTKLLATDGSHVDEGTPLLVITLETPTPPTITTNADTGLQTSTDGKPKIKTETIKAPHAGTLALPTLKDQAVSVGATIASVAAGTLSVSATLTPDQQYRLLSPPAEAQVTLKGGPAPFPCTGLRIGAASQPAADPPGQGASVQINGPGAGTGVAPSGVVTCAVPPGVTAFAGLGADIAITNGSAENAVAVPVTSVQGSVQHGNVWVVRPDGTNEKSAVALGLTDGDFVQVLEGLALGDTILKFDPVGDGPSQPDCNNAISAAAGACGR